MFGLLRFSHVWTQENLTTFVLVRLASQICFDPVELFPERRLCLARDLWCPPVLRSELLQADDLMSFGCLNGLFVLGRSMGFIGHHLDQLRPGRELFRMELFDLFAASLAMFSHVSPCFAYDNPMTKEGALWIEDL